MAEVTEEKFIYTAAAYNEQGLPKNDNFTEKTYFPKASKPFDARLVITELSKLKAFTESGLNVENGSETHTLYPYLGLVTFCLEDHCQYVYLGTSNYNKNGGWKKIEYTVTSESDVDKEDVTYIVYSAMSAYTIDFINNSGSSGTVITSTKVEAQSTSRNLLKGTDICLENDHFKKVIQISPNNADTDFEKIRKLIHFVSGDTKIDGTTAIMIGLTNDDYKFLYDFTSGGTVNSPEVGGFICVNNKKRFAYKGQTYKANGVEAVADGTTGINKLSCAPNNKTGYVPSFFPVRGFFESGDTSGFNSSNKSWGEDKGIVLRGDLAVASAETNGVDTNLLTLSNLYKEGYSGACLYLHTYGWGFGKEVTNGYTLSGNTADTIFNFLSHGYKIVTGTVDEADYKDFREDFLADFEYGPCDDYIMDLNYIFKETYWNWNTVSAKTTDASGNIYYYYIDDVGETQFNTVDKIQEAAKNGKVGKYLFDNTEISGSSIPIYYVSFKTNNLLNADGGRQILIDDFWPGGEVLVNERIFALYNKDGGYISSFYPVKYSSGVYEDDVKYIQKGKQGNDSDLTALGLNGFFVNAAYRASEYLTYEFKTEYNQLRPNTKYIFSFYAKKGDDVLNPGLRCTSTLYNREFGYYTTTDYLRDGYTVYTLDSVTGKISSWKSSVDYINYHTSSFINSKTLKDYYNRFWIEFEFKDSIKLTDGNIYDADDDFLQNCQFRIGFAPTNEHIQPFFFNCKNNYLTRDTKFADTIGTKNSSFWFATVCCPKLEKAEENHNQPTSWTSKTTFCDYDIIEDLNNDDKTTINFDKLNINPFIVKNDNIIPYPYFDYGGIQGDDAHLILDSGNYLSGVTFDYYDAVIDSESEMGSFSWEPESLDQIMAMLDAKYGDYEDSYKHIYWNKDEKSWYNPQYFDYRDAYEFLHSKSGDTLANIFLQNYGNSEKRQNKNNRKKYKLENGKFLEEVDEGGNPIYITDDDITEGVDEYKYCRKKWVASCGISPLSVKIPTEKLKKDKEYILSFYMKGNRVPDSLFEISGLDNKVTNSNGVTCYFGGVGGDDSVFTTEDVVYTGKTLDNYDYNYGPKTVSSNKTSIPVETTNFDEKEYKRFWMKFKSTSAMTSPEYLSIRFDTSFNLLGGPDNQKTTTLERFVHVENDDYDNDKNKHVYDFFTNLLLDTHVVLYNSNAEIIVSGGTDFKVSFDDDLDINEANLQETDSNYKKLPFFEKYVWHYDNNNELHTMYRSIVKPSAIRNLINSVGSFKVSGLKLEMIPDSQIGKGLNVPTEWCEGSIKRYCAGAISVQKPWLTEKLWPEWITNKITKEYRFAGFKIETNPNEDFRIGDGQPDHYYRLNCDDDSSKTENSYQYTSNKDNTTKLNYYGPVWFLCASAHTTIYESILDGDYSGVILDKTDDENIIKNHITTYYEEPYRDSVDDGYAKAWVNAVQDFRPYHHTCSPWVTQNTLESGKIVIKNVHTYQINQGQQCYPLLVPTNPNIKYGEDYKINKINNGLDDNYSLRKYTDLHIKRNELFSGTTTYFKVILERR